MSDSFYRAFEDRYRGSRDLIKTRLQVYLPFITPLHQIYPGGEILDLGCGRGEWLELMQEQGFRARGVDLDEGMLQACKELGLPVVHGDALTILSKLPEQSLAMVSGFHVIEHVTFDMALQLINEAWRVLKPGGLLILETPNPQNVLVACNNFYLDPTHEKPLPNQLLSFLTETAGFSRSKILGLNEPASVRDSAEVELLDVFSSVSPDYAVIAQKEALVEHESLFNEAFSRMYGVSLEVMAFKYDRTLDNKIDFALRDTLGPQLQRLLDERDQAICRERAILGSMSWRVTRPLRSVKNIFSYIFSGVRRKSSDINKFALQLLRLGPKVLLVSIARRTPFLRKHARKLRYWDHRFRAKFARDVLDARDINSSVHKELSHVWRLPGRHECLKSPLESWFDN